MSEERKELVKAFVRAQAELGPAHFDKVNPHFKSKYTSMAGTADAAKVYNTHGIAWSQRQRFLEGRFGIDLTLLHDSGQVWETYSFYPLRENLQPQQLVSETTYARRTQLSSSLGIVSDDDDDGNEAQKGAAEPNLTNEQVVSITKAALVVEVAPDTICKRYGVKTLTEIPASRYDAIMKKLAVAKGTA